MIDHLFCETPSEHPVTLYALDKSTLAIWLASQPNSIQRWVAQVGFAGEQGSLCWIPNPEGELAAVLTGAHPDGALWSYASLPRSLPPGVYVIGDRLSPQAKHDAALGWALGGYGFQRYKPNRKTFPQLLWPEDSDRNRIKSLAEATYLVRDLINTPAEHMGPPELAKAAQDIAASHNASFSMTTGDDLLVKNYPLIHAVGRASAKPPCLVDLRWGDPKHPKLTLVGKGVCFDTGGLDIKSDSNMKLMKKDMGGAAHALGLAQLIMQAKLPVSLRLLIPCVENSIAGNAMRPLDVFTSRKGLTVEIGHTDAEGRVILADALSEAASEKPDLLIDIATLTGAARVALGTELPALFCNNTDVAQALLSAGERTLDPLWQLPLHKPYRKLIESKTADLTNSAEGGYGGAITAALFLQEFVGEDVPWIHIDVMAWNLRDQPGRPMGGEAMGLRALFEMIKARY